MQALKAGAKRSGASGAPFHLASSQANRHLSLMSLDRGDLATAHGLGQLSAWSDDHLASRQGMSAGSTLALEAGLFKALLKVEGRKDKSSARCRILHTRLFPCPQEWSLMTALSRVLSPTRQSCFITQQEKFGGVTLISKF